MAWKPPQPAPESLLYTEQDHAADRGALMVFLIGVPTSGGGVKEQVADMKGQQIALHGAILEQNCFQ